MISKLKPYALTALRYAKVIWDVPAVKSVALTWLIRVGVPSGAAAILIPILDAISSNG